MVTETQKLLLKIVGYQLFGQALPAFHEVDWTALLLEAENQSVFPSVFSIVEPYLPEDIHLKYQKTFFVSIAENVRNAHLHGVLHSMMGQSNIPYVVIKGMASASYYPDPLMRTMGDVDFFVSKELLDAGKAVLLKNGYTTNEHSNHRAHYAFKKNRIILEMHWEPNGIPKGEIGDVCRSFFDDMIASAQMYEIQGDHFLIPDTFHHGLVLLLHTATHMVNTGIGLRHLCDWAAFAGRIDDHSFSELFEEKLKQVGLWRFAQLLTQVSIRYLGCPEKAWAKEKVDQRLLSDMIEDVFAAGNFGKKDAERINEAKLITTKEIGSVDQNKAVFLRTLSEKACQVMPICKTKRWLLPAGWIFVCIRHIQLVFRGKRPTIHVDRMITGARKRKKIYKQFRLFH